MERSWVIHKRGGNILLKESEAIENAMEQKVAGIKPMYRRAYKENGKTEYLPAGWLVWSTWIDGCGVVYPRKSDGKMIVCTGWQGDFVIG